VPSVPVADYIRHCTVYSDIGVRVCSGILCEQTSKMFDIKGKYKK